MSSGRGRMASRRASRAAEQPWMSPTAMVRVGIGVRLGSGARHRREEEGDGPMATFTKTCFYCKREFESAHRLANICSPACQKRQRSTAPRKVSTEPVDAETMPGKAGRTTRKARPEPAKVRPE